MENIRKHLFSSSPGGANGRTEGKSVFHTKLVSGPSDLGECLAGIREYVVALSAFCGAGTHLGSLLSSTLHETAYAEIAGRFHATCTDIEGAVCQEGSVTQKEIESLWSQLGRRPNAKESENNNIGEDIQLVAKCFVRILQLHCQFFLSSSEALAEFNNLRSLDDLHADKSDTACDASQSGSDAQTNCSGENSKSKSNAGSKESVQSPSGIRRQITSFISKLGKASSSAGSSHSAFYVDAPLSDGTAIDSTLGLGGVGSLSSLPAASGAGTTDENAPGPAVQGSMQESSARNVAQVPGADAGSSVAKQLDKLQLHSVAAAPVPAPRSHKLSAQQRAAGNGAQVPNVTARQAEVASQEELDNVIDFLSGCPKLPSASGVEGIVAPPITQAAPLSKAVGGHLPSQNVFMPNNPLNYYSNQQRVMDAFSSENPTREAKTHTWPYRPAGRPGGSHQLGGPGAYSMFGDVYGSYGNMDTDYTNYLSSVRQMQQGLTMPPPPPPPQMPPPGQQMVQPGAWSTTDTGLNKPWQSWYGTTGDQSGGDNVMRQWSTLGDSSSCSDESSNGEVPWMMMGLDLNAMGHKRRHSSGEEGFHQLSSIPIGVESQHRPHSVEDLLEPKSTNTWPPKQPWAKVPPPSQPLISANQRPVPVSCDQNSLDQGLHPSLGVQWSDPSLGRQQTTWASGMVAALSGQGLNSYSNPPPGGTNMENIQHSKLERKYSVLT